MNIESKITLALNIRFDVCHFEVIVNPVNNEVREPWILSTDLEKFVEKFETFLTEVVTENFEAH